MGIEIKNIEVPLHWESSNDYDSHRPLLWLALENTGRKSVMEFGCGYGSTPLLSKYCKKNNRFFFSYETNMDWAVQFELATLVSSYEKVSLEGEYWRQGVLFIDCAPGEIRKGLIAKHANNADVIVTHDSEDGANYVYNMKEILSSFKYRIDYKPEGKPWATAVSNIIDVGSWAK